MKSRFAPLRPVGLRASLAERVFENEEENPSAFEQKRFQLLDSVREVRPVPHFATDRRKDARGNGCNGDCGMNRLAAMSTFRLDCVWENERETRLWAVRPRERDENALAGILRTNSAIWGSLQTPDLMTAANIPENNPCQPWDFVGQVGT